MPAANALSALESFTEQERFLIAKTEEAIHDGRQLERWCLESERTRRLALFPLDLKKTFRLANRAEGFFDTVPINGQPRSVMGCVQTVEFGKVSGANAAERVRQFVLREFLSRSHWTYPDGDPGGFTVEQGLYRTTDGAHGRFDAAHARGCVDLSEMGKQYAWVLLTVHIHDFVMEFAGQKKRLKEAACVSPCLEFVHINPDPAPDKQLEITVGYPFVAFAPVPNFFGFGPGKFGVAVKTFTFLLTQAGDLRVRMLFAAAPRCEKVLDFGKGIPDPVYGGAALLNLLTLGLWKTDSFHNKLDTFMLCQHCRVHQAFMDGVEKIWTDWEAFAQYAFNKSHSTCYAYVAYQTAFK